MVPGMENMNIYIPDWAGVTELSLGNSWRAVWVNRRELPEGAPLLYGYAVVVCEDKGYVTRPAGDVRWAAAEGAVNADERPEAFVKRIVLEQTGAQGGKSFVAGFLEVKATSHNPDFPAGFAAVRPVYLHVAAKMQDIGKASGYERRRLPLNEFAAALRKAYPELHEGITAPVDHYLVMKAKGTL